MFHNKSDLDVLCRMLIRDQKRPRTLLALEFYLQLPRLTVHYLLGVLPHTDLSFLLRQWLPESGGPVGLPWMHPLLLSSGAQLSWQFVLSVCWTNLIPVSLSLPWASFYLVCRRHSIGTKAGSAIYHYGSKQANANIDSKGRKADYAFW